MLMNTTARTAAAPSLSARWDALASHNLRARYRALMTVHADLPEIPRTEAGLDAFVLHANASLLAHAAGILEAARPSDDTVRHAWDLLGVANSLRDLGR